VYFLFVIVWLSVPVQSIAWKNSSPKWPTMCRVAGLTVGQYGAVWHTTLPKFEPWPYHLRKAKGTPWEAFSLTLKDPDPHFPSGLGYSRRQIPHQRAARDDTGKKPTIRGTGVQRLSVNCGTTYSRFRRSAGMYWEPNPVSSGSIMVKL